MFAIAAVDPLGQNFSSASIEATLVRECVPYSFLETTPNGHVQIDTVEPSRVLDRLRRMGLNPDLIKVNQVAKPKSFRVPQKDAKPSGKTGGGEMLVGKRTMRLSVISPGNKAFYEGPVSLDQWVNGEWKLIGLNLLRGSCSGAWSVPLARPNLGYYGVLVSFSGSKARPSWTVPKPVLGRGWYRLRVDPVSALFRVSTDGSVSSK